MAKKISTKVASTWRNVKGLEVKIAGVWRTITKVYTRQAGVWKIAYENAIPFTISTNSTDLDLFVFAGSPIAAGNYVFTINTGVTIKSSISTIAAMASGSFPAGSTIGIINNGSIIGGGGKGGRGGFSFSLCGHISGANGIDGGHSIDTLFDITIDNTNGYIFGGGGGGGGGESMNAGTTGITGGGGGGVAGNNGGDFGIHGQTACASHRHGDDGTAGTTVGGAGGIGGEIGGGATWAGNGGNGGEYGANGAAGTTGDSSSNGGLGGAAGKAVNLNGNSITWDGGNTPTRVKGAAS